MDIATAEAHQRPFETHAEGLGFPEGPVALPDGGTAFVDLLHQKIRIFDKSAVRVLCSVKGSPNGMRLGPDGALYVANNGGLAPEGKGRLRHHDAGFTGRIQRVTLAGKVEDFATDLPGEQPWRPNDLIFAPSGDIVFTDPQNWEVIGDRAAEKPYLDGQLLASDPGGAVRLLAKMTGFPNGLAFHPEGSLLVGLSVEHRIVRFDWKDGAVSGGETWIQFDKGFGPDGMAFHGDRLFVAGSVGDRLAIVGSDARIVEMIDCGPGSDPTNLCINDDRLWVTFGMVGKLVSYAL
jgi:sugar lactone lactonase YvrE